MVSACTILFLFAGASADAQAPQILWWYDLDAPSFGSAATADIDGDGKLEIVFGTYFNDEHIHALNAEDGSLLWKYDTGGCNDASPVIADVDLDGELEVIAPASSPYKVYCFNGATGAVEWSTSTGYPNCIDSPPAVADVDNDSKPEVVLGTFYGHVFCLNGEDGSVEWNVSLGNNSYIQTGPNILDLDGNGSLDVVIAQWLGDLRIYALNGADGSVIWFSDAPSDYIYHGGSFADVDEDGKPEIAIGSYDHNLYLLNGESGRVEWNYTAPYYAGGPSSIADLDGDGHLEVVFTAHNRIIAVSHLGNKVWSFSAGGSVFRGVAISDVDDDNILDVVFGSADGYLRALNGDTGQAIWAMNLEAHYGQSYDMDHAPIIADFDNDGILDVFVIGGYGTSSPPTQNHGRAYALSTEEGTGRGWPMFRHDMRHSACFDGYQPLMIDFPAISGSTGGAADLVLAAGKKNANRHYFILGSLSGNSPGFPLPGGLTLPINWDPFTGIIIQMANTPVLSGFYGTLDLWGQAVAKLDTLGPLPPPAVGLTMDFAYLLYSPYSFVSNPAQVFIVP